MSFSKAFGKSTKLDPFASLKGSGAAGGPVGPGTFERERGSSFSNLNGLISSVRGFPLANQAESKMMELSAVEDSSSSDSSSDGEFSDYLDPSWVVDENEQEERKLWREKQQQKMLRIKLQQAERKRKASIREGSKKVNLMDGAEDSIGLKKMQEIEAERDVEDFQSAISRKSPSSIGRSSDASLNLGYYSASGSGSIIASLIRQSEKSRDPKEKESPQPSQPQQADRDKVPMRRQTTPIPPLPLQSLQKDEDRQAARKERRLKRKVSGGRQGREKYRRSEFQQRRTLYEKRMQDLNEWYVKRRKEIELEFQDVLRSSSYESSSSSDSASSDEGEDESAASMPSDRGNAIKTKSGKLLQRKSTSFRDMMSEMKRQKQIRAEKKNEQQNRGRQREKPEDMKAKEKEKEKELSKKRSASKEKQKDKDKDKRERSKTPKGRGSSREPVIVGKRSNIVFEETDDSLSKKNPYVDIFRSHSLSPPRNSKRDNLIKSKQTSRSSRNNKKNDHIEEVHNHPPKRYNNKPLTRSSSKRMPIPSFTTDYEGSGEETEKRDLKGKEKENVLTAEERDSLFWAERNKRRAAKDDRVTSGHRSRDSIGEYPYPSSFPLPSSSASPVSTVESYSDDETSEKDKIRNSQRKSSLSGGFYGLLELDSSPRDRHENAKGVIIKKKKKKERKKVDEVDWFKEAHSDPEDGGKNKQKTRNFIKNRWRSLSKSPRRRKARAEDEIENPESHSGHGTNTFRGLFGLGPRSKSAPNSPSSSPRRRGGDPDAIVSGSSNSAGNSQSAPASPAHSRIQHNNINNNNSSHNNSNGTPYHPKHKKHSSHSHSNNNNNVNNNKKKTKKKKKNERRAKSLPPVGTKKGKKMEKSSIIRGKGHSSKGNNNKKGR